MVEYMNDIVNYDEIYEWYRGIKWGEVVYRYMIYIWIMKWYKIKHSDIYLEMWMILNEICERFHEKYEWHSNI